MREVPHARGVPRLRSVGPTVHPTDSELPILLRGSWRAAGASKVAVVAVAVVNLMSPRMAEIK